MPLNHWSSRTHRSHDSHPIRPLRTRFATGALALVLLLALGGDAPLRSRSPDEGEVGLPPTGVGLPSIGESSTVGAGELASALVKYHDSGEYESDLTSVDQAAQGYPGAHLR